MLKKMIILIISCTMLVSVFPVQAETEYELWTQSPGITSGITTDEMRIYKAMNKGEFDLYKLDRLGANYYLGICEAKTTDGGYNSNKDTSCLYYYTLLATENSFIILSSTSTGYNEYYWDYNPNFMDLSSIINASYYSANGSETPLYLLNPNGKYTNSNYTEYDEYFIITSTGKIYSKVENAEYGAEGYPVIQNGTFYMGNDRYRSNSSTYYYYMSDDSTKATQLTPQFFINGSNSNGSSTKVATSSLTTDNGYTVLKEGFPSNISKASYYKIPDTDNLYFATGSVYTYNSTAAKYYYYDKVDVYQNNGGTMTLYKTYTLPTTNTYQYAATVKSLSGIDSSSYTSKGYSTPKVLINQNLVILQDGTIGVITPDSAVYTSYNIAAYNNKLVINRNKNGSSYLYWKDTAGTYRYWQNLNCIYFDHSGTMTMDADISLQVGNNTGQNGYYSSYSSFSAPDFSSLSYTDPKIWWGRCKGNVFPDGRYVTTSWTGIGNSMYEIWYNIYNADGTLKTTGPTGYSTQFGSVFDTYDLIAIAVNNSKFVTALNIIDNSFIKEYYRVAVAKESDTGEVTGNGTLGNKNILPPDTTDTEPVQSTIDFGQDDLPLGYNVKNNVIGSSKLDSALRQQVNVVRLNDIVIVKKSGYVSGGQNTGIALSSYSTYDYSFGSTYIRFYSSGQYLYWYCYNPESLSPGTYYKVYTIGDKTVYLTVKVISAPSNNGMTSVVF